LTMKYLSIFLRATALSLFLVFSVSIGLPLKAAEIGEKVLVLYICKDLDALMKVAEADVTSTDKAEALMNIEGARGACVAILPATFQVNNIMLEYKDSKGKLTQIIEIKVGSELYYFLYLSNKDKGDSI
jgi:hypothetical protein